MPEYKTREQKAHFYNSWSWRKLRKQILRDGNNECLWCKNEGLVTTKEMGTLEIDHIEEIEFYPELALDPTNMRILCKYHHNQRHNRFDGKKEKENKWQDECW